jgi:3'-phosphoadenosine 5'-phosphosulfate sulfotransferase (PAPS reductase)/FAD synthetase
MNFGPYLVEAPALISFSGGRSSAFMLKQIIDEYGGRLPENVIPCFANTGKEMPQTLDFVAECGERWGAEIIWLEFNPELPERFERVTYATASRNGEPYEKLLASKQMLPNPVTRFCTSELKIRTAKRFAKSLGWEHWTSAIGLRADEPRRVAKIKNQRERWETIAPLAEAGVTKRDVMAFWQAQHFDLRLPNINGTTPLGNCDLCFLKGAATIQGIMRDYPHLADWWIEQEATKRGKTRIPAASLFRMDRPCYAAMLKAVKDQKEMDFGGADTLVECFCHD